MVSWRRSTASSRGSTSAETTLMVGARPMAPPPRAPTARTDPGRRSGSLRRGDRPFDVNPSTRARSHRRLPVGGAASAPLPADEIQRRKRTYRSSVRPPTRNPFAFTTWPVLSTCAGMPLKEATPEVFTGVVPGSVSRRRGSCDSERTREQQHQEERALVCLNLVVSLHLDLHPVGCWEQDRH